MQDAFELIGKKLGQYEIQEKVGQGGMAQVFRAYQPGLQRHVAVKILSPLLAIDSDFTRRFEREAHSIANLHHPNIVQVYDFGKQDNYHYLVMRYVEKSITLDQLIKEKRPLDELIGYIVQVADALSYAHQHNVIHRDVKPSNILIDGRWALLSDFGLARIGAGASDLTQTGMGMGTPAYMSPEQALGHHVDFHTDIYALGIILYQILAGQVPHKAPTPAAILIRRTVEPVPSLRELIPNISEELDRIILKSLASEPNDRPETAIGFVTEVKNVLDHTVQGMVVSPGDQPATGRRQAESTRVKPRPDEAAAASETTVQSGRSITRFLIPAVIIAVLLGGGFLALPAIFPQLPTSTPMRDAPVPAVGAAETPSLPSADTPTPEPATPDTPGPVDNSGPPQLVVRADQLPVLVATCDQADILYYLSAGAEVELIGRAVDGNWWQLRTTQGNGWVQAAEGVADVRGAINVPLLPMQACETPTPVETVTPTPTDSPEATATPTDSPEPTATQTPQPAAPTATSVIAASPATPTSPPAAQGTLTLLRPLPPNDSTSGITEFVWQWNAPLESNQGFEIRVWQPGAAPQGAHDAVQDNLQGRVINRDNNTYSLTIDIRGAAGVQNQGGEYRWTVVLIQVEPGYQDLGRQAPPGSLRLDVGGGGGGDGGSGGPIHD